MVDRLNEPDSRLHGSLVTNVLDLVEILPRLNVNGDTDLNRFAEQVKERLLDQRLGVLEMSALTGRPLSELSADTACAVFAEALRQIHAVPVVGCPLLAEWSLRIQQAEERSRADFVDESDFDDENLGRSSESILAKLRSLPPLPKRRCLTHGEATLENFLAQDGKLSGIVDMGRSRATHPSQDWALALRSMRHHFGPEGERHLCVICDGHITSVVVGFPSARTWIVPSAMNVLPAPHSATMRAALARRRYFAVPVMASACAASARLRSIPRDGATGSFVL
jgi:hypothetical protein